MVDLLTPNWEAGVTCMWPNQHKKDGGFHPVSQNMLHARVYK